MHSLTPVITVFLYLVQVPVTLAAIYNYILINFLSPYAKIDTCSVTMIPAAACIVLRNFDFIHLRGVRQPLVGVTPPGQWRGATGARPIVGSTHYIQVVALSDIPCIFCGIISGLHWFGVVRAVCDFSLFPLALSWNFCLPETVRSDLLKTLVTSSFIPAEDQFS